MNAEPLFRVVDARADDQRAVRVIVATREPQEARAVTDMLFHAGDGSVRAEIINTIDPLTGRA